MTYRLGHHSTSDDSSRYRTLAEVEQWRQNHHPIPRVRSYLYQKNWWTEDEEKSLLKDLRKQVLDALKLAEQQKKPPFSELFTDVYDVVPPHLEEQKTQLLEHLAKYPDAYPTDQHQS
jgi:2-oxoisovalerate dehydrogenase E1 component alpha subunit